MNEKNNNTRRTLTVVLLAFSLVMAPVLTTAAPIVDQPGVLEVGTIDAPGHSEDSGGSGSETAPPDTDTSADSSTCLIPWFGGGCLLEFNEHEEQQSHHYDQESSYYHSATDDDRSGYYVNVLDGIFWVRTHEGQYEHEEGSGNSGVAEHYDREYYENNLGYSEEHTDENNAVWDNDYASSEGFSELGIGAGTDSDFGRASVIANRQMDGHEESTTDESSSSDESSSDSFFGIPIQSSGSSDSHELHEEYQRTWDQTIVETEIFLIEPLSEEEFQIIGLSLDKGDEEESGSSEGRDESSSHQDFLGFTVIGSDSESEHDTEYWYWEEWLRISVDVVSGAVEGDVIYEHGESEEESHSYDRDTTEVVGVPFGSDSREDSEQSEQWRRLSFAMDIADGVGSATFDSWDEDSESHSESEGGPIVIIPLGSDSEEDSQSHSDGWGIGVDLGEGEFLWLNAGYENATSASRSQSDITIGHSPLFGSASEEEEDRRSLGLDSGSGAADSGIHIGYEEAETHDASFVRLGGSDTFGTYSDEEYTRTEIDGNVVGELFVFDLSYQDGEEDQGITVGGTPIGIRNDYSHFTTGVGSTVENPAGPVDADGDGSNEVGPTLAVLSFRHTENRDDRTIYAGDSDIGRIEQTETSDAVSFVVLSGLAGAEADRSFTTTQVFAGETELIDTSTQQGGASVWAGDASIEATALFFYADFVDIVGVAFLLATWCVDPGVDIPYGTISDVINLLPPEVATPAGIVVALLPFLLCGGLPVPLLLLANDCLVADIATALVFAVANGLTGLLPEPVGGVTRDGLDLAGAGYDTGRGLLGDLGGCFWVTVPEEARNQQAVLEAMEATEGPPDDPTRTPLDGPVEDQIGPRPVDPWPEVIGPALEEYWPRTDDVYPVYDELWFTAYEFMDLFFQADELMETPDLPMPPFCADPSIPESCVDPTALPALPPVPPA